MNTENDIKRKYFTLVFFGLMFTGHLHAQNHEWSFGIGGTTSSDNARAVIADKDSNVIMVGTFMETVDFNPGAGTANLIAAGTGNAYDGFVAKYTPMGSYQWAFRIGSTSHDYIHSVDVDTSGNIYVTGAFQGTVDFNPGPAVNSITSQSGGFDLFVAKYDPFGNYQWAHGVGGSGGWPTGYDASWGVGVSEGGDVYITGHFQGTADFDPGVGVANMTSFGDRDAFLVKYDKDGNYIWSNKYGGVGEDAGKDICIAPNGNVIITGYFSSTADFDPGLGTFNLTSNGGKDIFVAGYAGSDGALLWANLIGGSSDDEGFSVCTNSNNQIFATGYFQGTVLVNAPTTTLTSSGLEDMFIVTYDGNGAFINAIGLGNSESDISHKIKSGSGGNIYLTGSFRTTVDFDPGVNSFDLVSDGSDELFVATYDANLNLINAFDIGSTDKEVGMGLEVVSGSPDQIFITGDYIGSVDFDISAGTSILSSNSGSQDMFMTKYTMCPLVSVTDLVSSCDEYTWIDGVTYYSSNNTATYTISGVGGCDTIRNLNLTITPTPDVFVNQNGAQLTANQSGADYSWLDCNNNYSLIFGETNQAFTPGVSGSYAVLVSLGSCSDTSSCYVVDFSGLTEYTSNLFVIHPNPVNGVLYLENLEEETSVLLIELRALSGELISKYDHISGGIDVSNLAQGIYYLNVVGDNNCQIISFVKY